MPLSGERLVIEPRYRDGAALAEIGAPQQAEDQSGVVLHNRWWSSRLRKEIYIWEEKGKIEWGAISPHGRLGLAIKTLGCSVAWGIEQEGRAMQLLGTLLRHHQFKDYLLTGMFLEKSKRSGLTYLFRKLRPTIAIDARKEDTMGIRILAALCMHPIAFYADSWAGAMTPTDEVCAHLTMMRGDEHMFWKRSNQHAPDSPAAGI